MKQENWILLTKSAKQKKTILLDSFFIMSSKLKNNGAYKVLIVPDPKLKDVADPVEAVTDDIRQILNRMTETMRVEDGVGLAATQVGIKKRLIVMDIPSEDEHDHKAGETCTHCHHYKIVNPVITAHSEDKELSQEGCLSIPGQYGEVERYKSVTIEYWDENGDTKTLTGSGLLGHCIQHEIDHLNGILFIDYLGEMKRKMMIQKARKAAALNEKRCQENAD